MIDRRGLRTILVSLSVAGFVLLLTAFNASKPRILVLHSATADSRWADGVDRGIRAVLEENRRPVTVHWHRLGLTRRLAAAARASAVAEARRAIAAFDPDVLVAVDDEANAAVARHFLGRRRPRILYVSIDQPPDSYGYSPGSQTTGIVERLPLAAVRDALVALRGGTSSRIAAVGIDNETGRAEIEQVKAFDWSPHTLGEVRAATDAAAWKRFIQHDAADADVLLVLSYAGLDESGRGAIEGSELASWAEAQARPLPVGLHAGYVRDGGGLAISPPPSDYGRRAMAMALDLLASAADEPRAPPPVVSEHFDVSLDRSRLSQRGVVVPAIYIEAARAAGSLQPGATPSGN